MQKSYRENGVRQKGLGIFKVFRNVLPLLLVLEGCSIVTDYGGPTPTTTIPTVTPDPKPDPAFVIDNAKLESIRKSFLQNSVLDLASLMPKLKNTWDYAQTNYFVTITISNKSCTFIQDPSQGNLIVSEGIGFWLRIIPLMARLDPTNAASYQTYFDQLLNAQEALAQLAKDNGNSGELMAWATKIENGQLVLDTTKPGPANSAADADLDVNQGLIDGQQNVSSGLWVERNYAAKLATYAPTTKVLFQEINGVKVTKPSEDWSDFYFGDYPRALTGFLLNDFYQANGNSAEAAFWHSVGIGSYLEHFESVYDTGNCPAQMDIVAGSKYANDLDVKQRTGAGQGWDGGRLPLDWGLSLAYVTPNTVQEETITTYLSYWDDGYTVPSLDAAMYLLLALRSGDTNTAQTLANTIASNFGTGVYSDLSRYYQTSLILLALLNAQMPVPQISNKYVMAEIEGRSLTITKMTRSSRSVSVGDADYAARWNSRQGQ